MGIEVELEGLNLPKVDSKGWYSKADGSLRATRDKEGNMHNPLEYILRSPVAHKSVEDKLEGLKTLLKGSTIELSNRCSVHVHLNTAGMALREVYTWLCVYYILEDLLIEYCGEDRKGNLFCLSGTDAEFVVQQLANASSGARHYQELNNQHLKYAACNIYALVEHGSLEFRAHGGIEDPRVIKPWVDILMQVREGSKGFKSPKDVVENFSLLGPMGFLKRVLGEHHRHFQWKPRLEQRLWDGVRLAQDIAWSVDWEEPKKGEAKAKPVHAEAEIWDPNHPNLIRHGMYSNDSPDALRWSDSHQIWCSLIRWREYERAYPNGVVRGRHPDEYNRFPPPGHARVPQDPPRQHQLDEIVERARLVRPGLIQRRPRAAVNVNQWVAAPVPNLLDEEDI